MVPGSTFTGREGCWDRRGAPRPSARSALGAGGARGPRFSHRNGALAWVLATALAPLRMQDGVAAVRVQLICTECD
jgi:hypothetical protein